MSVLSEWIGAAVDTVSFAVSESEQAAVDRENARRIQRAMARERMARAATLAAGGRHAGEFRSRGTQVAAAQRVAFANGNVDSGSGTAADVQASAAIFSELDAQTSLNNARAQALGHDAVLERYETQLREMEMERSKRGAAVVVNHVKRMANFTSSALGGGGGM